MRYHHILFDLDGTLTDPAQGICGSVMYALQKGGYPAGELSDYYRFIGPPLLESLQNHCHTTQKKARVLLEYYRERYAAVGLFENRVYPGIPELLSALHGAGAELILATSKPENFAQQILEHFELAQYFDCITGSDLSGLRDKKALVIAEALKRRSLTELADCIMVGDRLHDVLGARECGLDSVGVLYGYGSVEELEKAGATFVVDTVEDLCQFLLE